MGLLDQVKTLLEAHNIKPKKTLGQNFCVDSDLLEQMVEYAEIRADDTILEIGSGLGFLTTLLSMKAKKVIAVEFDSTLIEILKKKLARETNISIVEGDILKISLPQFDKIVANPPYHISARLINVLLDKTFDKAILTLQKEFAEKLIYKKKSKSYRSLTVFVDYKWNVKIRERLSRSTFYPIPEVDSVIIQIEPRKPAFNVENEDFFFKVVKILFTKKRKKLRNALTSFLKDHVKIKERDGRQIIHDLPFLDSRVDELEPANWGFLSDKLYKIVNSKLITYKNRRFYIFPEVYQPSEDTFLLASNFPLDENKKVLDMGTGCGLLGILAAEKAEKVVAIDVNPYAVECAKLNTRLNGVADKVNVRQGDLFDSLTINEQFDLILFNPPYLPIENVQESSWLERAWNGGPSGRHVIDRFLGEVSPYIENNGSILLVQSSLSNPQKTIDKFKLLGFNGEILAEEKLDFEFLQVLHGYKQNKN